jgi:pimeloyl-ACP methyl ester carboxylesterase
MYRRAVPTYPGSDATPLHYDVHGSGAPLVALAGGPARHPSYLGDLAGLSERWQVVVPHLRGVGLSPQPDDATLGSFWRQADDVEQLRRHLGQSRLLLLGHSAGTRLAISYAVQYPDRVAALVLVTPPAGYLVDVPSDASQLREARAGDPSFDAAMVAWEEGPPGDDDAAIDAWQQRMAPVGYAAWGPVEQAHNSTAHYSVAANAAYFSVDPPSDLAVRLGLLSVPVLVVAGAQDCITGLAPVTALAGLFPTGAVAVLDRCGHYPWVEQPAAFRHAVDTFLDTLP